MANRAEDRSGTTSVETGGQEEHVAERRRLTGQIGPLVVDWPKAAGYYGGVGLALAFGLIEPPLGLFIVAVPLFKILNRPEASRGSWMIGEVLEGASTPVGGSASPVIRVKADHRPKGAQTLFGRALTPVRDLWTDAKSVARGDGHEGAVREEATPTR